MSLERTFLGTERQAVRVCRVCGAVPWDVVAGCGDWRQACRVCGVCCALRIADGRIAWVPLCHGDCSWACRVGGAVPWGLLLGVSSASSGWRRVLGIADQGVV